MNQTVVLFKESGQIHFIIWKKIRIAIHVNTMYTFIAEIVFYLEI